MLSPSRIVIWEDAISKEQVLHELVEAISREVPGLDVGDALARLREREEQGSTFLNEGVALPHARVTGLATPTVALGVTHGGVLDAPTSSPIEVIFLMLSPTDAAPAHLRVLAAAGRALQNRSLRKELQQAGTPAAATAALRTLEC